MLARWATCGLFFTFGLSVSAWIAGVPGLKEAFDLDDAQLGMLLLCYGMTCIIMAYPNSQLVGRLGPKTVTYMAVPASSLLLSALPWWRNTGRAPHWVVVVGGMLGSGYYTAFTVKATRLEQLLGKSVMSSFHACFSLGALAGSSFFSALLRCGLSWSQVYPLQVLTAAGLTLGLVSLLPPDEAENLRGAHACEEAEGCFGDGNLPEIDSPIAAACAAMLTPMRSSPQFVPDASPTSAGERRLDWRVLQLATVSALALFTEASVGDWGALFFMRYCDARMDQGPLLYAAFAFAMIPMRLFGDGLVDRYTRETVFLCGGLISFAGFASLVAFPTFWGAFCSAALVGMGLANNVPIIQTCAARSKLMSIAEVTATLSALNSAALLGGPSIIGPVSRRYGLRVAYLLPVLATTVLASSTNLLDVNRKKTRMFGDRVHVS
ncbi:major facilitator family transporter [Gregarina niphandrodes]|uniref:Major facilitator family transporter n=1 Tax=Gregarina niphandrodes TaxID=110365 RepID=A0A023BCG0_GRENI|nr:major facilitator family transporter [Gregarina niphandrodes]EZG83898.1 major facilitator family transporter [Gregarina niphandrodes]|eukprot:XP_011128897.1 major facilitator family transporter [Gregarina niphandrodes]